MLNILGIVVEKPVITDEDRELFAKWNEAKKAKDFAKADALRDQISALGYTVKDTAEGPVIEKA